MDRQTTNELRMRSFEEAPLIAFVCECADDDCRRTVALSPEAYRSLRSDRRAVLFAGHPAAAAGAPISTA